MNNTSVVLRVLGPGSSALLMGDLEPPGWHVLRANHLDLRSDVLKFPHHGGAWDEANTKALLDAVQPSFVIISVGTEGERYNHPNSEVFNVLSSPLYQHIRILCTQATNQCQPAVLAQRQPIIELFDQQASDLSRKRIGSKQGCPCAGTILIELSEKATILQPSTSFHQKQIIFPHFQTPQCHIAP